MRNKTLQLLMLGMLVPGFAVAASPDVKAISPAKGTVTATPSDAEAEAAFAAAQKAFQNTGANQANAEAAKRTDTPEVMVFSDPNREMVPGTSDPKNLPIHTIRVVVDVENTSLRDIMHKVVTQAARYTGPWQVKWRLKPENVGLMDERVNLTAEAKFGDFIDLLTERVKNMSGVQLFVTTFNESRIIMVADTYY